MTYVIRALGVATAGKATMFDDDDPQYLQSFDVDAHGGHGTADFCADPAKALQFASKVEAFETWKTRSNMRPFRDDGFPNRPLTAFHVEVLETPTP